MASASVSVDGARVRVESADGKIVKVDLLPLGGRTQSRTGGSISKDPVLVRVCDELRRYLRGELKRFTVPFAQPGPDFYQKVWKALAQVPYGRALTYGELAKAAGRPRAARAVGTAMNRNRLPLLVPCHRVVASTGLGGFGCGLAWKRRLLDLERGSADQHAGHGAAAKPDRKAGRR